MPYFWMLSAHQETMWPLTAALNLDRAAKLPFASAYFFEFYTDGPNRVPYVNTVYRDDKGKNVNVVLDCSEPDGPDGSRPCKADAFKSFISDRLMISNQVSCDQDYNSSGERIKYADIDDYTRRLLRDIGLKDHIDDEDGIEGINTAILDWILGMDGASTLVSTSAVALAAIELSSL